MTVKESHTLNWWWTTLVTVSEKYGRGVTAGELSDWTGQSRGTCKKYLDKLVKNRVASSRKAPHWNGAKKTVYDAQGMD